MINKSDDHRFPRVARKYRYYLLSILELITRFSPRIQIVRLFAGQKKTGTSIVSIPSWGLSFEVRSAMDVWSLKETFIDRFYEKYGCAVSDGWVVIDIGGGIGDFSIFASHTYPANRVFAFEPYRGSFSLLVSNLQRNRITNVQAFQEAVWSSGGNLAIDTSTGEPVQFISREIDDEPVGNGLNVSCVSLHETLERLGIQRCDLLKVDAEGAEYAILFQAPDAMFEKIERIVMEYHDALTHHTHPDMIRFLQAKGYRVNVVPNAVHPELGYLYAER